jgi:hypothetical protein
MALGSMGHQGGSGSPHQIQPLEARRFLSVAVSGGYPGFCDIESDRAGDTIHVAVFRKSHTFTLNGVTYNDVAFAAGRLGQSHRYTFAAPDYCLSSESSA